MLALWRDSPLQKGFEHAFHFFFALGATAAPLVVRLVLQYGRAATVAWYAVALLLFPGGVSLLALAITSQPDASGGEDGHDGKPRSSMPMAVALTGAFLFVYVGIEVAFGGYLDLFVVHWLGASRIEAAGLTSVYWAALCVGRAVAAVVTPFVNHTRYLAVHLILAVVASLTLGLATLNANVVYPDWYSGVVVPSALFGFALAPLFPGAILVAEELLGGPVSARHVGAIVGAAAAGEMTLPMIVGALVSIKPICFAWSHLVLCLSSAALFFTNSSRIL